MISMNIDYKKFSENLLEFEKFNDQLPNERKKIDNYNSLANIYISYKGQISDANTKAIEIVEKAYEALRLVENENLMIKYELDFEQKLAQAFYSRGVNSKDKVAAKEDYEQAIEHYQNLLHLNASNEEEILVKIGVIYQEMGELARAVEQFQGAIKNFPKSIDAYVKLGNLLLDMEQSKAEGSRNYQAAKLVYEQANALEVSTEDEAFKKLKRRFDNLSIY
jgi:tetratricopeptide (TPR) repeat protein